jgi:hypothetical protein
MRQGHEPEDPLLGRMKVNGTQQVKKLKIYLGVQQVEWIYTIRVQYIVNQAQLSQAKNE